MINETEDKTLSEVGIDFSSSNKRTTIKLVPISSTIHRRSAIGGEADSTLPNSIDDDELALGASASPVEPISSPIPLPLFSEESTTRNHNDSISLYPCMFVYAFLFYFDVERKNEKKKNKKINSTTKTNDFHPFFSIIISFIIWLRRFGESSDDLLFK